jgi:rod shape-determining protein MreD
VYFENKKFVFLAFLFGLIPSIIVPSVWPWVRLTYFAPFLCLMCYKRPLNFCLWYSIICGLIIDLLGAGTYLGLYAATYSATTLLVYGHKQYLFEDQVITLPIMTFFFAIYSTALQAFFVHLNVSWKWALTDLVLYPFADALYALLWFALPAYLLRHRNQSKNNILSFKQ